METISNQAHVSFSYTGSDVTKTNDSNIVNTMMKDKYSFTVTKTSTTSCFRAGDTITYMIDIKNTGCGCLSDFTITDNLGGEGVSYVEGSARLFVSGSMREITPTDLEPLTFVISDNLNRNEEMVLHYSVLVSEDISSEVESIENRVCVKAYPCGCGCEKRECITECTCLIIPKCTFAEVLITKAAASDMVCCEDELDYFITLTNTGNVDATNVIVTDSMPSSFTLTEVHMENNGNHYMFDPSEYDVDAANFLTLPNATGTAIYVPAIGPGVDNTTRIRLHGHM